MTRIKSERCQELVHGVSDGVDRCDHRTGYAEVEHRVRVGHDPDLMEPSEHPIDRREEFIPMFLPVLRQRPAKCAQVLQGLLRCTLQSENVESILQLEAASGDGQQLRDL